MVKTIDIQKRDLKMYFKLWKAQIIKEEDIPDHIKKLIVEYYPVEFKKVKEGSQ